LKHEQRKSDEAFVDPKLGRITVQDLVDDLLEHYKAVGKLDFREDTARRWRNHLSASFAMMKAASLGTSALQSYRAKRMDEGASVASVNREVQVLRKAFKLAYEHEPPKVKRVPKFTIVKEENARQGFVTVEQFQAIRAAALREGPEFLVLVELAHWLGWRRSELLGLHVANIRFSDGACGVIRLEARETKNKRGREVPLDANLRMLLQTQCIGKRPDARLFGFVDYRYQWARIVKAAGCPGLLFHDMRRSSARDKLHAGVSPNVIMEVQGWETPSMFNRYAIVATADKADALRRQADYERQLLAADTRDPLQNRDTVN
jgi:integrase